MQLRSIVAIATLLITSTLIQAAPKRFYASVYSTNPWKEASYSAVGIYSFALDRYDRQLVKEDSDLDASGGGTMTEDFYFCTSEINYGAWTEVTHFTFKPSTWSYNSQTQGYAKGVATDLAYDHITAKIYGCFAADAEAGEPAGGYMFGTINETNGSRHGIKAIDTPWIALGCNRQGQLYAVTLDGDLLKVNKVNGSTDLVANLGFTANRRSTGAFDTATGTFYVVATTEDSSTRESLGYSATISKLYAIDVAEGKATLLYQFGEGEALGGMYIPGPLADDAAPGTPTDVALALDAEGSLAATMTFTMPQTTFSGATLSGDVKYLIRANGSLFAQGTSTPGSKISAHGKVDADGLYDFTLELSNTAGRGERTTLSQWMGHDTPSPLTEAGLTYADGAFTLTWANPTITLNGGYFDPAQLSYTVTRLPDDVVVATATKSTTLTDSVATPSSPVGYSYRIDMLYRDKQVSHYTTATYNLGSSSLPFTIDFAGEDSFANLTVIDANGDRAEWYREYDWWIDALDDVFPSACYPYSSTRRADDWLILPALDLQAGVNYLLTFQVSTASESTPERLAVTCGSAPSAEVQTTTLMAEKEYITYQPVNEAVTFTPSAAGACYIAFHALSEADGAGLGLRLIKVDLAEGTGIDTITGADRHVVRRYTLQGIPIAPDATLAPGTTVIDIYSDGTVAKTLR